MAGKPWLKKDVLSAASACKHPKDLSVSGQKQEQFACFPENIEPLQKNMFYTAEQH